jgi:hypothetical protein
MNTVLTKEQHMAVDRYYWDGLHIQSLYFAMFQYSEQVAKNTAWMDRTNLRMIEAIDALNAVDPKDMRKHKDASIEVDNCTKLLARLTDETVQLKLKYASTTAQHAAIYARRNEHPHNGVIASTSRIRYPKHLQG